MDSKRYVYRVMALLLAAVCLFCCAVEALSEHGIAHTCTDEDCLVCLCVSLREQLAGMLLATVSLFLLVCFVRLGAHSSSATAFPRRWTPVCLKVKLSN